MAIGDRSLERRKFRGCSNLYMPGGRSGWHLLRTRQLLADSGAITTELRISPRHNKSILKDCCERIVIRLDLLHVFELHSDCAAATAILKVSPSHNRPIGKDYSESRVHRTDLLRSPAALVQRRYHHQKSHPGPLQTHCWRRKRRRRRRGGVEEELEEE